MYLGNIARLTHNYFVDDTISSYIQLRKMFIDWIQHIDQIQPYIISGLGWVGAIVQIAVSSVYRVVHE